MEQIIQDICGKPLTFGPVIVVTAIIIIATGLLIYRLTEKKNSQKRMQTYIFIEGQGWLYEIKGGKVNVRELCREFQREGFCEGLPDQPEDDTDGSTEEAEEENQG